MDKWSLNESIEIKLELIQRQVALSHTKALTIWRYSKQTGLEII